MKINVKINSLSLLFIISIYLIPYEAIPNILPSVYRPISIFPIILFFLLIIFIEFRVGIRIDKVKIRFILFCFSAIMITILLSYYKFNTYNNAIDFFISLIFGIITFWSFNKYFEVVKKNYSNDTYIEWFFKLMSKVYIIPILIALIELLCLIGILPISIKVSINRLLGGFQYTRITMGSSEASWVSMQLLIMLPIFLYLYKKYKKKRYLFSFMLFCLIFIYNVSMQGFITLIFAFVIYTFIMSLINGKVREFIKNIIVTIIVITVVFITFKFIVNILPQSYYTIRLNNMTNLSNLIRMDGSAFVRIVYPLTSGLIFIDNPILGIGGGNFGIIFGEYIQNIFPWAIAQYPEVAYHIKTQNTGTGSLYLRVLAEFGVIGGILFYRFIYLIINKIKRIKRVDNFKIIIFWCVTIFSIMIQFDSFAYIPFWIAIAFINNFSLEIKNKS